MRDEFRQHGIRQRLTVSNHAVEIEDQCSHGEPHRKMRGAKL